ncbi:MFS transporter [Planosporangium flavigriseum]|uniref:MFS transporter n=1 Tax=Planosporangium flavigriseum TaxID=373681 RepID=UPI00143BC186|nr:MFS transporter [Planosporangium flavigriseum]NJC63140.1 MFS transporter [Planosporangium flavigriseum]
MIVTVIATGIMIIACFAEYALGTLGPVLGKEMGISTSFVGILTSVMFASAGVASLPTGWVVDRFSASVLVLIQILLSTVAFAALAFLETSRAFLVVVVITGLIMAMSNPLTNRLVRVHLPAALHVRSVGWKSMGPQMAALLAGIVYGLSAHGISWRALTLVIAVGMAAFGVLSFVLIRRPVMPETDCPSAAAADEPDLPQETRPIVWWLVPFGFFSGGAIASIGAYIPLYAYQDLRMSFVQASAAGAVIALASIVGRVLWLRFLTYDNGPVLLIKASVSSAVAVALLAVSVGLHPVVFWTAVVLTGATALVMAPLTQIIVVRNASARHIGVASAWVGIGLYAGFAFQPWLVASLIDTVGLAYSWYAVSASGMIAALIMAAYVTSNAKRRTQALPCPAATAAVVDHVSS